VHGRAAEWASVSRLRRGSTSPLNRTLRPLGEDNLLGARARQSYPLASPAQAVSRRAGRGEPAPAEAWWRGRDEETGPRRREGRPFHHPGSPPSLGEMVPFPRERGKAGLPKQQQAPGRETGGPAGCRGCRRVSLVAGRSRGRRRIVVLTVPSGPLGVSGRPGRAMRLVLPRDPLRPAVVVCATCRARRGGIYRPRGGAIGVAGLPARTNVPVFGGPRSMRRSSQGPSTACCGMSCGASAPSSSGSGSWASLSVSRPAELANIAGRHCPSGPFRRAVGDPSLPFGGS